MIIYSSSKKDFVNNISNLPRILRETISEKLGEETSDAEFLSWRNSLRYMGTLLECPNIPNDAGIALEYNIPVTNNRIDFIISGLDSDNKMQAVLIELKQWQHVQATDKDGIVITHYADGMKETIHPSYQVACYASLLYDFKEAVQRREVLLHPCAYLHNYNNDGVLNNEIYSRYVKKAEVFCKGDEEKLRNFISKYIRKGDQQKAIYTIENSKIVPSKSLIDCVVRMAEGSPEFKMIDEQKVVYQNILWAYEEFERTQKKQVVIVKGGPGTGKSVIAIKTLVEMTRRKHLAHYITKNAAPRNVLYSKFRGVSGVPASVRNLFKSSGIYYDKELNEFDMLIVDEAHRLQEHSGIYGNLGENQIKEIINASKVSVFFIDERQIISLSDIGTVRAIESFAHLFEASVHQYELTSQFRCSGSDEYLNWLDHILQYDNSTPINLSNTTYDFRVMDSTTEVMEEIKKLNRWRNKSRVVAGYCWPWASKNDSSANDIVFDDCGFAYKWNLASDTTWSISKGSVNQIGCIHTCQGLEFEYVGVIIGEDLICQDGKILVQPNKRASDDFTVRGWRKRMSIDSDQTHKLLKLIIKNTYRTLLTRGMKGCFVYACNNELQDYLKNFSQRTN